MKKVLQITCTQNKMLVKSAIKHPGYFLRFLFLLSFYCLALSLIAQPDLYGTTSGCGQYGNGTIFKIKPDGSDFTVVHEFPAEHPETSPGSLMQASNGKIYGTAGGGIYGGGVLIEYNPATGTFIKIHDFENSNGKSPNAILVQADNGKLYGTTNYGGNYQYAGTIFEYDPATGTFAKKYDFDGTNGSRPWNLTKAFNGKLYGVASGGGCYSYGAIFEYDPETEVCAHKFDYDDTNYGYIFDGALTLASNGKLYGMNPWQGSNNMGYIFEFDPETSAFSTKFDFDSTTGDYPFGSLLRADNGKLYGMTHKGGAHNRGALVEYDPETNLCVQKYSFNYNEFWHGSLIQAENGKLYGTTGAGGNFGFGVIFEYDVAQNTFTHKFDLDGVTGGSSYYNNLMQASNGKFYGTTQKGGICDAGVIFEYDLATNVCTKKSDFGSPDGARPYGSLVLASNGKLYGTTSLGGKYNAGVIFEYDPVTKMFAKKSDFDKVNGSNPVGVMVLADNGKLYGMASGGGYPTGDGHGVLFEYDLKTGIFTRKFTFDYENGSQPRSSLTQAWNGKLYGMTSEGGKYSSGVLFEYDPRTNTFTKKLDFDATATGGRPYGSLVQASNGALYGTTFYGGKYSAGTLFEYDPVTNVYTQKLDFDVSTYESFNHPQGDLIQASNGKLYGLAAAGGAENGVIFEYNTRSNACVKKLIFDGVNGVATDNGLMQASNGKIYGMTDYKGPKGEGIIFDFDPASGTSAIRYEFEAPAACYPSGFLTEVFSVNDVTRIPQNIEIFPNPGHDLINVRLYGFEGKKVELAVYDVLGRIVWQKPESIIVKPLVNIDLSGHPEGIYWVSVRSEGQYFSESLMLGAANR